MGLAMGKHRGRGDENNSSSQTTTIYKKGGDELNDLGLDSWEVIKQRMLRCTT